MGMRDIVNRVGPVTSIAPQAANATQNGTGVDLLGFAAAAFILTLGAVTGTTPTATVKFQESDDNTTFTDIAVTDLDGGVALGVGAAGNNSIALAAANASTKQKVGYLGNKRYVRAIISAIAGTTPVFNIAVDVVRGRPDFQPVP